MPSFAIEAPAEANPLTNENVYHVLLSASSSNSTQVQTGTKQLRNWERYPGYFSVLQSLYIDLSLPTEVRYLSIIQLKNAVDKYWRKGASNAVSTEEKAVIRSRSLESVLQEPAERAKLMDAIALDHRLALQSSLFVSKVIRSEYPRDWPDAVPTLVSNLQSAWAQQSNSLRLSRMLLVVLNVLKELSTARLRAHQQSLIAVAPDMAETLFLVYEGTTEKWLTFLENGGDDEGGALDSMERSLLALRVIRRLLVVGFAHQNRSQAVCGYWTSLNTQFGRIIGFTLSGPDSDLGLHAGPKRLLERHLVQIAKLHLNMVKEHAAAFALLPGSVGLLKSYWQFARHFSETYGMQPRAPATIGADGDILDDEVSFSEKLSLKSLLILRACSKMVFNPGVSFKYQSEDDKEEKALARTSIKAELLTPDFAREIMETLMSRFFVFTPRDLKQWEQEPDEWEKSQEGAGDDWEFSIRTCSEKLFLDLIVNYKHELVPTLINTIITTANNHNEDIFHKDSTYAAIGLAAQVLHDKLPFEDFLNSTLLQEVQVQRQDYKILRRRIAIVLGQWLLVKDGLNRPLVYQIFQHLLDKDDSLNDEVVRVTAGRQLYSVIDPFEFSPADFAPFAPLILQRLLILVDEVQLPDTKFALLKTLRLVVEKMERQIIPFADQILSLLSPLWDAALDDLVLKEEILVTLTALVNSMGADSLQYHHLMVPLIRMAVTPESDSQMQLILAEETMVLWSAILFLTPTPPSPPIIDLFQFLVPMLELASDNLVNALKLIDAYIYLIPADILPYASLLFGTFADILQARSSEAIRLVTNLVELLIQQADRIGGVSGVEELTSSLVSTPLLSTMLDGIYDAHESRQTTGPNQRYPKIDGITESDYLSVLARLTVASPNILISAIGAVKPNQTIDWLLTEWFTHIDNISPANKTKLSCLALTALLETGQPWILNRLQLLMTMWTSVLMELEEEYPDGNNNTVKRDTLVYTLESLPVESSHEPGAARSRELTLADPVHRIDTRTFLRERLQMVIDQSSGLDSFREKWIGDVDVDVLKAFSDLDVL